MSLEAEKLLEESNLNEQFGWLYKDEKYEIETDDVLDTTENDVLDNAAL